MLRGVKALDVYELAFRTAMEIFQVSKSFPKEERYSLTDQVRRCSRSVVANIAEGYRKRLYPNMFASKLADADGEAAETVVFLDFAKECGSLDPGTHARLSAEYERVGSMLGRMISTRNKFIPRP